MNYTQCGSALALPYADGIAQTCVTSPPYYGLRDYGTARWDGGDAGCDHRQAGTRAGAASTLRSDGREHTGPYDGERALTVGFPYRDICGKCGAKRIDSQIGLEQTPAAYVAQIVAAMREVWRVLRPDATLWLNLGDSFGPNKQLMGIPWRVAFALQDDGWYLRSDIIWAKPNPMPESVTDRPTKAHEYVFLLAKQPRYYYDAEAIAEAQTREGGPPERKTWRAPDPSVPKGSTMDGRTVGSPLNGTRNARSVWQIATQPYSGAHFATMPPELARRCILAGSRPGDIVLDPFAGSGTTAMVALQNGRQAIGTELNPKYLRLQDDRTQVTIGLGMVLA